MALSFAPTAEAPTAEAARPQRFPGKGSEANVTRIGKPFGQSSALENARPYSSPPFKNLSFEGTPQQYKSFRRIGPARLISFGAFAQTRSMLVQWTHHHHDSFENLICQR